MPPAKGTIDDSVKAAEAPKATRAGGSSIFDDIGNSIDSLIDAFKSIPTVARDAADYTYDAAKPIAAAGLLYLTGGAALLKSALITGAGFVAGKLLGNWKNGEKKTFKESFKQLSNEATIGTLMGGFLSYVFKWASYAGNLAKAQYGAAAGIATKAASSLVALPSFMITEEFARRALIRDYTARSWKKLKEDSIMAYKYLGLPIMANFALVPEYISVIHPYDNMFASAAISTVYAGLMTKKTEKTGENKQPQMQLPPGYGMPQAA